MFSCFMIEFWSFFKYFRNFLSLCYVLSSRQRAKKTILNCINPEFNAFYVNVLFAVHSQNRAGYKIMYGMATI